jgi:hypothetical protein
MFDLEYIKRVHRIFKRVSDGAHGNTRGFHGSLTANSLQKVFNAADVYGSNFVDIGFGTGVVLAAALTSGASKAFGFELPENQANQLIFHAAMRRISNIYTPDFPRRAVLEFNDIVKVWLGCALFQHLLLIYNHFSEIAGGFAASWNRVSIFVLEWNGVADSNSHS